MIGSKFYDILNTLNNSDKRILLRKLKHNAKKNDIDALRNVIIDHGGINYTENKIDELKKKENKLKKLSHSDKDKYLKEQFNKLRTHYDERMRKK